ncbi:hypothetical protein HYPGJ_31989 [Hyphomicrobium sp. GJ21]|nr:hypothetical protein HYPGJ_31989 [Hyphomicrobium sp. GJ21]
MTILLTKAIVPAQMRPPPGRIC